MDWASEVKVENNLGFSHDLLDFHVNGKIVSMSGWQMNPWGKRKF